MLIHVKLGYLFARPLPSSPQQLEKAASAAAAVEKNVSVYPIYRVCTLTQWWGFSLFPRKIEYIEFENVII